MITVNDIKITQDKFGDGTLKCAAFPLTGLRADGNTIKWLYDGDEELFTLYCIARDIQNKLPGSPMHLIMPYIPHARQDRDVSGRLFTLKYFAEIINSLDFRTVAVFDPHSDVSPAVIDRMWEMCMPDPISSSGADAIMYPDAGAAKKYGRGYPLPAIIGNKHRNAEGRIDSYELLNFTEGAKKVIIRDDICSYGGTFVAAAKALRARDVEYITLFVSHCENNILKGDVFKYIDKVITTDSICTVEHPQIEFIEKFRT